MTAKKIPEGAQRFVDFFRDLENKAIAERMHAEEVQKHLLANLPKLKRFFWDCDPKSVEHLLFDFYPHYRMKYTREAAYYKECADDMEIPFRQRAEECLLVIQHKKLFNIQCLWRAEKVRPAGADIVYDFRYWDENLYQCPFLPPITEDEVELLVRFLNESPTELLDYGLLHYNRWQNYEHFKISYAEEEEIELEEFYQHYILIGQESIPPWYEFYDTYMGTGGLLALPDLRYPKESNYSRVYYLHREEMKSEKQKASDEKKRNKVRKYWLGANNDLFDCLKEMVEEFETPENKINFANYAKVEFPKKEEGRLKEDVEFALYHLWLAREPVHIDEGNDWREAILQCFNKYRAKKIIEAIPIIYEQYRMCIDNNITVPTPGHKVYTQEWINNMKKEVLEGRKLLGELENFDY